MNGQKIPTISECLKILNIDSNASIDDIKKAYRQLVKKYHPDLAGRNEFYIEKFREVTRAYKTLLEAIDKDNGKIIIEENHKNILREFFRKKFKIREYIELFKIRKKPKYENINFNKIFLKKVSDETLRLGEDELILRLEGSTNFYVILESIKALYKLNSKRGLISIVENFYKYPEELKDFVIFLLKRKTDDNFYEKIEIILNKSNYFTTVSLVNFLYKTDDKSAKRILKEFLKNYIGYLKNISLLFETIMVKISNGLNKNELRLGEKLILKDKITPFQLIIAIGIKNKFPSIKIGKIILDLGFIKISDLKEVLTSR